MLVLRLLLTFSIACGFILLFLCIFFFFFVLSPGLWSLQVFCRSWIRYPGGCFAAQILNWVHWVLSSLFFF